MTIELQLMYMHSMRAPPLYCQCAQSFLVTTSRRKYISLGRREVTQVTGHSLHRLNWLRMLIRFISMVHIFFTLAVSNVEKGLVGSLLALHASEYK